jgi:hypothetical protein
MAGHSVAIGGANSRKRDWAHARCWGTATLAREDRHANARRPPCGLRERRRAARVEPSPEGLAQVHTAARADTPDECLSMRRLPASMGNILPVASTRVGSPVQARARPALAIKTGPIASLATRVFDKSLSSSGRVNFWRNRPIHKMNRSGRSLYETHWRRLRGTQESFVPKPQPESLHLHRIDAGAICGGFMRRPRSQMSLIRSWGRIGHERQDHGADF